MRDDGDPRASSALAASRQMNGVSAAAATTTASAIAPSTRARDVAATAGEGNSASASADALPGRSSGCGLRAFVRTSRREGSRIRQSGWEVRRLSPPERQHPRGIPQVIGGRQQAIRQDSERIHVTRHRRLSTAKQFRRHVGRSAHQRLRRAPVVGRARGRGRSRQHNPRLPAGPFREEDVFGLDVAVQDPVRMGGGERGGRWRS